MTKVGKIELLFGRLIPRVSIIWRRLWPISIVVVLIIAGTILYLFSPSLFGWLFRQQSDIYVLLGALAVFIVAWRQERIEKSNKMVEILPFVVRDTPSGTFNFDSDSLVFYSAAVSELILPKNILRVSVKNKMIATDIGGYILHQNHFYKLKTFSLPGEATQQDKSDNAAVCKINIPLFDQYTWATEQHPLYFALDDTTKQRICYPGSYYCIAFSDLLGNKYFLEEDTNYRMVIRDFRLSRPKFSRDYLSIL